MNYSAYHRRSKKGRSPPQPRSDATEAWKGEPPCRAGPTQGNTCLASVTEYAWPLTRFLKVIASKSRISEIYGRKCALRSEDEVLCLLGAFMGFRQSPLYVQHPQS